MDTHLQNSIDRRKDVIHRLKQDLIQRLSLPFTEEDLHEDISLIGSGLGLDSLDALEVILGIEQEFNVKVEEGNISLLRSINTVVDYILHIQDNTSAPSSA
jgi:acyl carrier protein